MHNSKQTTTHLVCTILLILFVFSLTIQSNAVNRVVTNISDSGPNTMRDLIAASADGDTITFSSSTNGTTILLSSQIALNNSLVIIGNGIQNTILNGNGATRIFTTASGKNYIISELTFRDGFSLADNGGAIYNNGNLALVNCLFDSNNAGAFGGAIFCSTATLSLTKCTLAYNSAMGNSGGAIYSDALSNFTCSQSTFNNNHCNGFGGAVSAANSTYYNSTFSGNNSGADGGGIYCNGTIEVNNCTVVSNNSGSDGGGLAFDGGSLLIHNSILAYNATSGANKDGYLNGTLNPSSSNNIISNSTGFTLLAGNHNQLDVDPLLEAIADNGGPTQTCALMCSSPAVDSADAATSYSIDQRGELRGSTPDIGAFELIRNYQKLVTNANDTGAGSLRDAVNNACNGDTIQFDPSLSGATIIISSEIPLNVKVTIIGLGRKLLTLDGNNLTRIFNVSITGELNLSNLTITNCYTTDGGGAIYCSNKCSLINCDFLNNLSLDYGGVIVCIKTLVIDNCNFIGNEGLDVGSVIDAEDTLLLSNSTFARNSGYLGTISAWGFTIFTNSTFSNNHITQNAGAARFGTQAEIRNCTFVNNTAGSNGGAINCEVSTVLLVNNIFSGNSAGVAGNDIFLNAGTIDPSSSNNLISDTSGNWILPINGNILFANPQVGPLDYYGGQTLVHSLHCNSPAINSGNDALATATDQRGIARPATGTDIGAFEFDFSNPRVVYSSADDTTGGTLRDIVAEACPFDTITFDHTLDNVVINLGSEIVLDKNLNIFGNSDTLNFIHNSAGRIFTINPSDTIQLQGVSLTGYSPSDNGGGVYNSGYLFLNEVRFDSCVSGAFAGALFNDGGTLIVTHSTFEKNRALGNSGGAIYNNAGALQIQYSTLDSNQANGYGGAISGSYFTLYNSTISANYSGPGGGGVYIGSDAQITNCTFANNSTGGDGGAILVDGSTLELINSIAANNTSSLAGPDISNAGTISSLSNSNLIGNNSSSGFTATNNNLVNVDPYLGPLANYGGHTKTHSLLCGSPAINLSDSSANSTVDQREVARIGTIDAGAYEFTDVNYAVQLNPPTLTALQSNATYQWYDCGTQSIINGANSQIFIPFYSADYAVIISYNGCTDTTACINFLVNGLDVTNMSNQIQLYPNPASTDLYIELNTVEQFEMIRIISLTGQLLSEMSIKNDDAIRLNIAHIPSGVYFVEIENSKEAIRKRFIKN